MSTASRHIDHDDDDAVLLWARRGAPAGLALAFAVMLGAGFFQAPAGWTQYGAVVALLVGAAWVLTDRLQHTGWYLPSRDAHTRDTPWWAQLEGADMGALWLTTAYVLLSVLGPVGSDLVPLVYLLVAFLATFHPAPAALCLVGWALALEGAALFAQGQATGVWLGPTIKAAMHGAYIAIFGTLSILVARPLRSAASERDPVALPSDADPRAARLRQDADALGLLDAIPKIPDDEGEALALLETAIGGVHAQVESTLGLLHVGLDCHAATLLWVDDSGEHMDVRFALGVPPDVLEASVPVGSGALANVVQHRTPLRVTSLSQGWRALPYYQRAPDAPIGAFLGVPVLERPADDAGAQHADDRDPGRLLGVLCLDRATRDPFTEAETRAATLAAEQLARALDNEALIVSVATTRRSLSQLYSASRRFNHALTPEEVYDVALETFAALVPYDFAALIETHTAWDDMRHTVARCHAPSGGRLAALGRKLQGSAFDHNTGLVSMAVEVGHALPYSGAYDEGRNVVFARHQALPGIRSILVLPLIAQDDPLGAVVIASSEPNAFDPARKALMEVLTTQCAISVQNARMYAQMEQMATTDALTGLNNRRTFMKRLDEVVARSERTDTPFCLLITDIDHFKSVNDTYGHPVGDEVLRQVSATFRDTLRQTDIPARYGGEEFVVVLEGTDLEGAHQIADRLRTEASALRFDTPQGTFSITMSFGLAQYPSDTDDRDALIELADQALYYAKTHGRDQVRDWDAIRDADDLNAPKH